MAFLLLASSQVPLAPHAEGGARRNRAAFLDGYVIERVADTTTPMPGGTGPFATFGTPSIGGGTVAFRGDGEGQKGVYAWSAGALRAVGDLNTPAPGGAAPFTHFGSAGVGGGVSVSSEGTVAFIGQSLARIGIYTNAAGPLELVVDDTFATPEQLGATFTNFFHVSHDAGQIAFTAVSDGFHQGLYLASGPSSIVVVADSNTSMPGGAVPFLDFGLSGPGGHPSLHAGQIAFIGSGGHPYMGVYRYRDGALSVVADQDTVVPGSVATFPFFAEPDVHAGEVVFRSNGIYRAGAGGLVRMARGLDAGVAGFAYAYGAPAVHEGQVVFDRQLYYVIQPYLSWLVKAGVYTRVDGALRTLVDSSRASRIDGKRVKEVVSGKEALSGGVFVFKATFSDGSQGIYRARPATVEAGRSGLRSAAAAVPPEEG
jgi:hypothetical protein